MGTENFVSITGNLTRDPELAYTGGGQAYARFGIAQNRRYKKKGSDDWTDDPNFFNVTVWGELAEHLADSVSKGDRVNVIGRLEWQKWEKDGEEKTAIQIVADAVSPDLRWATAAVTKSEKTGGSGHGSSSRDDVPPIDEEPF